MQILEAGRKAASLTQQLLAYSRRQHQFLKIVNLNELLTGTERMLRRLIGEDIEVTTTLAPTCWRSVPIPARSTRS